MNATEKLKKLQRETRPMTERLDLYKNALAELKSSRRQKPFYEKAIEENPETAGENFLMKLSILTWLFRAFGFRHFDYNGYEIKKYTRLDYESDFIDDLETLIVKHSDILDAKIQSKLKELGNE